MKPEEIASYVLYVKLYKSTSKIILEEEKKMEKDEFFESDELDGKKKHIVDIYKIYSKIFRTIKQLETIVKLLELRPSVFLTSSIEVQYSDYLEYNLENYYLRITSILDQAVILVTKFYNLGLQPQSTSIRILRENDHTKDKEVVKLLKAFDKAIQPLKRVRNLIAHRGEFTDRDILSIKAQIELLATVNDETVDHPEFKNVAKSVDELVEKKVLEIQSGVQSAKRFVFALDHILSQDQKYVEQFS